MKSTTVPNQKYGTFFVAVIAQVPSADFSVVAPDGMRYRPGRYLRRASFEERAKAERVTPVMRIRAWAHPVLALWLSAEDTSRFLTELSKSTHVAPQEK